MRGVVFSGLFCFSGTPPTGAQVFFPPFIMGEGGGRKRVGKIFPPATMRMDFIPPEPVEYLAALPPAPNFAPSMNRNSSAPSESQRVRPADCARTLEP